MASRPVGITAVQKQALIDNLQLEGTLQKVNERSEN